MILLLVYKIVRINSPLVAQFTHYVHISFLTHDDIVTIEVDYVIIAIHYKKSHLFLDSAIQYTVTSSGPPKARPLKCM